MEGKGRYLVVGFQWSVKRRRVLVVAGASRCGTGKTGGEGSKLKAKG
jgi:hypothetical protein